MLTEMELRELGIGHEGRERYVANTLAVGGAAVLDSKDSEWYKRIDTKKLDTSTTSKCILGQLYGSHDAGVERLALKGEMDAMLGFICSNRTHATMLDAAWKYEIDRRLQAR
ncbi:hypothetical protein K2Q00_03545 [Patescibacteria group bacterium]|nr:hypothetical protein [Patescibacteria group bacterium]